MIDEEKKDIEQEKIEDIKEKGENALLEYAKSVGMEADMDGAFSFMQFVSGKPFKGKSSMNPPRSKEDEGQYAHLSSQDVTGELYAMVQGDLDIRSNREVKHYIAQDYDVLITNRKTKGSSDYRVSILRLKPGQKVVIPDNVIAIRPTCPEMSIALRDYLNQQSTRDQIKELNPSPVYSITTKAIQSLKINIKTPSANE